MCLRISTTTNVYEPTITQKNQPAQKANTQIESPIKEQPIKDSATIPKEGKVAAAGIEFVDPKQEAEFNEFKKKIDNVLDGNSTKKISTTTNNIVYIGIAKGISNSLIKVGTFGTEKAVEKAVSKQLSSISSGTMKAGGNIPFNQAVQSAVNTTKSNIIKELTSQGRLGISNEATKAIEKGVAKAVKNADKALTGTLVTETSQNLIRLSSNAAAKTAINSSKALKVGSFVSTMVTPMRYGGNAALLIIDSVDAYKKIKDPNVSGTSKALASATVALDVASIALQKKFANPSYLSTGMVLSYSLTGLSIQTSIASDFTKDKK